jgi:citrate synthase
MANLKHPTPETAIGSTHSNTETLTIRGRDTLKEIVGEKTFTEAFYFIVTGHMPDARQTKCFDACLTILMDHGLTPSALISRLVEDNVPDEMQVGIAAGLLVIANRHVGTMTGAGKIVEEGPKAGESEKKWAERIVLEHRTAKKRLPGFGHPHYAPNDPRAERLFEIASAAGCEGTYIRRLKLIEKAIESKTGRHLTLNVTGAIGAVLTEIGFPSSAMRGVAVVSRAAGLVAHMLEEKSTGLGQHLVAWADQSVHVTNLEDN